MNNCICQKHKDELKCLSLKDLTSKLNSNIQILLGLHELHKEFLPKDITKNSKFMDESINNQIAIIFILMEELQSRS